MSAKEEMAALDEAVAEALRRERAEAAMLAEVPRRVLREQEPLTSYYERVGEGEPEDRTLEKKLKREPRREAARSDVQRRADSVRQRPIRHSHGRD